MDFERQSEKKNIKRKGTKNTNYGVIRARRKDYSNCCVRVVFLRANYQRAGDSRNRAGCTTNQTA
jgi:hypothetical protein